MPNHRKPMAADNPDVTLSCEELVVATVLGVLSLCGAYALGKKKGNKETTQYYAEEQQRTEVRCHKRRRIRKTKVSDLLPEQFPNHFTNQTDESESKWYKRLIRTKFTWHSKK